MVKYKRGKFFLIVILIFLLIGIIIHAQNGFTIKGKITSESGLTSGAKVDIYRDGIKVRSVNVGDNGRYTLRFEFNHEYTLILSRRECFPKKLVISTIVPDKVLKQNADFPPFEVEQSLFTEIKGIEKSFSENTILKIFYDEQVDNFISEVYYNDAQIKKQIETAIWQSQQIGKTAEELNKLTAEEYRLLRKEYDQWLKEAGQYYNQGQFSEALNGYKAANRLFPKEQFPIDRIAEINDLLAAMRFDESRKLAVDREYTGLITQADSLFDKLQWDESKQKYNDALQLKPGEQYPQQQISKIEEELEKITAKSKGFERYRQAIQDGDRFAERKQFLRAMSSYKFALTFKPGDEIALQRIADMGVILDEVDADVEYNKIIAEADKILSAKKYNSAIKTYKKALDVKPDEQYPKVKIAEINDIFKAQEEQKQLAEAYNAKIKEADNAFKGKNYKPAKGLYQEALELQPNERYPVAQIGRIDRLLAQIEKDKLAAEQYASLLAKADTEFKKKEYAQAKTDYSAALELMPGDKYPRNKIFEINKILTNLAKLQRAYESTIVRADRMFEIRSYNVAKDGYLAAKEIKPSEVYPDKMITKIDSIFAEQARLDAQAKADEAARLKALEEQLNKAYNESIARADAHFSNKEYNTASNEYKSALDVKPGEAYPQQRIAEIEGILAKQAEAQQAYDEAIARADRNFNREVFDAARSGYNQALSARPGEAYPAEMVAKIDSIEGARARLLAEQKAGEAARLKAMEERRNKAYDEAIARADAHFSNKEYNTASNEYKSALKVKPGESYPQQRIAEIKSILAQLAKAQKAYDEAIARADRNFNREVFDAARSGYNQALSAKPGEAYPAEMVARIDSIEGARARLLAEQQASEAARLNALEERRNKAYDESIAMADTYFSNKEYNDASNEYKSALEVKPGEAYPQQRITEIEGILARLAEAQKAYDEAIARADRNFNREVFDAARLGYNQALSAKPGEAYPAEMVAKIDSIEGARARLLAEQKAGEAARLKALEEQRNKAYDEFIAMADAHFSNKEYNVASNGYKSALEVKPNEAYPQQRIAEIKGILARLAKAQKAYDEAIARADRNFNREVFDAARSGYNQALLVKPGEAYPAEMVARIDSIEGARARLLAEQQAGEAARLKALEERRNKAYNEAIAMGDAHFSNKRYDAASNEYKSALDVKPGEAYPQQRIAEIKGILAQQAEAQKAYDEAIARADKAFARAAYPEAQNGYNEALAIKPSEEYPKAQLLKISHFIEEIAKKQELERSYITAIEQADSLYNSKQFELSITSYEQALTLKPNEKYPKAQIEAARVNILELAKLQERQNARNQAYLNAIEKADNEFNARNFARAESGYNNALTIKPGEDYPKKQLAKIAEARRQAILGQYNKIVAGADTDFKNKQYQDARKKYSNALVIIPKDAYAVSRIAEIDNIIESMAAAERERKRIQQDYMLAISQADEAFGLEQYTKANNFYTLALTLKPSETYPAEKVEEIKQILERRKTDEKYRNILIAAYSLYQMKNYPDSRDEYVKALAIKPNEAYPKSQISKIDKILLEQERARLIAKQQATQSVTKQQEEVPVAQVETISRKQYVNSEMQQAYDGYIKSADMAFDMKEYNVARFYYREALGIIPDEPHPTGRLREIKKIIDGRMFDRLEREYQQWIDKADEALIGGELAIARAYYNRALGVKSQEQYPRARLDEIASRLQQQRGQQNLKEYQDLISIADKTLTERNYTVARFYYMKALHLRPSESYPKEQIKKIGRALGH